MLLYGLLADKLFLSEVQASTTLFIDFSMA
jgi:hypothetical protein